MLRALIIAGVSLMLIGFGAAGWQYWQGETRDPSLAAAESGVDPAAPDAGSMGGAQDWLISATGGAVPVADVRAYLLQDRAVPERTLRVTLTAALGELLVEGETLPDPAYLEVMADIRAPVLAEGLCPVLSQAFAAKCMVEQARVVPGSVDAMAGTARFRIELAYSVRSDPAELPDLALQVFESWKVSLGPAEGVPPPATAEAALKALTDLATAACLVPEAGQACRVLRMTLDFDPAGRTAGEVSLGSLRPLPKTMRIAPEITPAPEG